MAYTIGLVIACMVVSIILLGFRARRPLKRMQAEANIHLCDKNKVEILYALDANKIINDYKKLYPKGRLLRFYRVTMAVFLRRYFARPLSLYLRCGMCKAQTLYLRDLFCIASEIVA